MKRDKNVLESNIWEYERMEDGHWEGEGPHANTGTTVSKIFPSATFYGKTESSLALVTYSMVQSPS